MSDIFGGSAVTPMLIPDMKQTNPKRSDYIKNKHVVAPAIPNSKSGTTVTMTDVSPFEHTMSVKAKADSSGSAEVSYEMDRYLYDINGYIYEEGSLYGEILAADALKVISIDNFATQAELNGLPIGEDDFTEFKIIYNMDLSETTIEHESGNACSIMTIDDDISQTWGIEHINAPTHGDYVILRVKKSAGQSIDLTKVKVIDCGKNHFDKDNADIIHVSFYGKGSKIYAQGNYTIYIPCLPNQVYTVSKKSGTFTFLRMGSTAEVPAVGVTLVDFKTGGTNLSSLFMATSAEARYLVVNITDHNETLSDEELSALLGDIQIELRQGATEYEPFKRFISHPINADGTVEGVTSLYPTTTLISDTEGVTLDVIYNVDTKKYIDNIKAELAAMILNS